MDLQGLYELQVIDISIEQAVHGRTRLTEIVQHDAVVAELHAARQEIDRVRDSQAAAQSELDRIERESADIDGQRVRLEKQMKTIIAPREAEALQHEMQTLASARNELDDRGIELLEASSAADLEIVALTERQSRVMAVEAELATHRRVAEADADRSLAELRGRRESVAGALATEDLEVYERLRSSLAGIAVARVEHGTCSGCRMEISLGELDAIKRQPAGAAVECPNCTRLLLR